MHALRRATPDDLAAVVALQRAAYARNRDILGVEPLPLMADYADVLARYETWVVDGADGLQGALILEPRPNDLLIWSVAVAPDAQRSGLGGRLLAQAEARAGDLGKRTMRLYTGEKLAGNIAWYQRHGYVIERVEAMADRNAVHMVKHLA
jgi:ribosomal protein S18 acetylase RimI-like enzyme